MNKTIPSSLPTTPTLSSSISSSLDLDQKWYADQSVLAHALERIAQDTLSLLQADYTDPVRAILDPEEVIEALQLDLPHNSRDFDQVLDQVVHILLHSPSTSGPAFFNQLFAGRDPMGMIVEMLSAFMNHSMYTYKVAGPLVLIEDLLIKAMGCAIGFSEVSGIFTPGGSLSNLTGILCARDRLDPNAKDQGMPAQACIYTSSESHYSVSKAAAITGMGRKKVRFIEVDEQGRMSVDALCEQIEQDQQNGYQPMMINATAGTTVRGAFDPFMSLAQVAKKYGIWLHVDAAFGGTALWSGELRHHMQGVEQADSVTWDAHKAMGMPLTCSVFITKHKGVIHHALSEQASYLFQVDDDALNPGTRSLQCGRKNDALKLWAAWQYYGRDGWQKRIDRQRALALCLADLVKQHPHLELVEEPPYLNVCFYYPNIDSQEICKALQDQQKALIGYADVKQRCIIRAAVINPTLRRQDLEFLVQSIDQIVLSL